MAKYKCKNCKRIFESDYAPTECPHCDSTIGFKQLGGSDKKMPKWIWYVVGAIVGIILVLLLLKGCQGEGQASLYTEGGFVKIKVDNMSSRNLKNNYRIQVLVGTDAVDMIGFSGKDEIAVYDMMRMLVGNTYTFIFVDKSGKPTDDIKWMTGNTYYMETPPPAPEFGVPAYTIESIDREKKVYVIKLHIADSSTAEEYAINDNWQTSNVFEDVNPGDYTVYAKNKSGISEQPMFLKEIKKLQPPLSLQEIQGVLNSVSTGRMSVSAAQDKLADGNVNLKHSVTTSEGGTLLTLFDVLSEANWGTSFRVNSFQNDPNTNKIKSGSLDISIK